MTTMLEATKREGGYEWPASAFLHTPDKSTPSTWKLRIRELVNGKPQITAAQLSRAWQALTKGFRGNRVQGLSNAQRTSYMSRLRGMYRAIGKTPPDTKEQASSTGQEYLFEDLEAFTEAEVNRDEKAIKNVAVLGPVSRNGRRYLNKAIVEAVPLYENKDVFLDHPAERGSGARSVGDKIGWISNTRFEAGKIRGDLNLLESGSFLFEIAERNPSLVGLSHVAQGRTFKQRGELIVEEIVAVRSVDVVSDPATTSGLFEETGEHEEAKPMTLTELKEAHPELVEAIEQDVKKTFTADTERKALEEKVSSLAEQNEKLAKELEAIGEEKQKADTARILEEKLSASTLPDKTKARVRTKLADRVLTEEDITAAIAEMEEFAAELVGDRKVPITGSDRGPAKNEQCSLVEYLIYDLCGVEKPKED